MDCFGFYLRIFRFDIKAKDGDFIVCILRFVIVAAKIISPKVCIILIIELHLQRFL
jgi:hypothetical protein